MGTGGGVRPLVPTFRSAWIWAAESLADGCLSPSAGLAAPRLPSADDDGVPVGRADVGGRFPGRAVSKPGPGFFSSDVTLPGGPDVVGIVVSLATADVETGVGCAGLPSGTCAALPHLGQRTRRPARLSGTERAWPAGQRNWSSMGLEAHGPASRFGIIATEIANGLQGYIKRPRQPRLPMESPWSICLLGFNRRIMNDRASNGGRQSAALDRNRESPSIRTEKASFSVWSSPPAPSSQS